MSNYNYSIIADTSNALLNSTVLKESISGSNITHSLTSIDTSGDVITIRFSGSLTAEEQSSLTAIVNSHDGTPTPEEVEPQKVSIVQEIAPPPFANKTLPTGQKLFKRVHGVQKNIAANSTDTIQLIVPYNYAKINALEIIGSKSGDTGNFIVYDNASGTISTIPNYKLNQFGFDVCMKPGYHKEESTYDADVIAGMLLELEFTNKQNTDALIGVNFILHEVV